MMNLLTVHLLTVHLLMVPWRRTARTIFIGVCLSISSLQAGAAVKQITATFSPDPSNPLRNEFRNTTRNQGFCNNYPAICATHGIFSLRMFNSSTLNGPIEPNHSDVRKGAMLKTPAAWRVLTVRERNTGEEVALEVRIAGMGGVYDVSDDVRALTGSATVTAGHSLLWGSRWSSVSPPCRSIGRESYYGARGFEFFWLTPEEAVCAKQARFQIPGLGYRYLDFTYELRTPNPLQMSTGIYEGTQVYSVGPGGDFDLGDIVVPSDGVLQLDFTLSVEHTLKVDIPPGGNRVELVPQGGWQAWLNNSRQPTRLFRDQTFNISASSRFKMKLECGLEMGDTCGLRNADNHQVPMQISVSLPNGLTRADGSPVNRQPLVLSGSGTELFQPGFYVDRKPGTLHFEVGGDDTKEMLKHGGSQYSGTATVIWDSEV